MGDLSGTLETLVPTLGRRLLEKGIRLQDLAGPRARRSFLRPGQSGVGTQPCQRNAQGWLGNMGTLGMNHPILGVSNIDPVPHDTHMMQHIHPDDSFWTIFPRGQVDGHPKVMARNHPGDVRFCPWTHKMQLAS